jgi:ABC-2 type transport system permease protein
MNAIYILWLRQLKRDLRSRSWTIGALGQPVMFLLALGFGFGPIYQKAAGTSYLQFLAPGIISMGIILPAAFSGIEIVWDRQFGFLKETLVAPVSRFQIVLGRILGGATVALIRGMIVFAFCIVVGFRIENLIFLPVAAAFMFLIAVFCAAVGTAIGSLLEDIQSFQFIINFIIMPLFLFSNALFPVEGLSKAMRTIIYLNPLSYGIDGLRGALTHNLLFSLGVDSLVLGICTAILLAVASYLFSLIQL